MARLFVRLVGRRWSVVVLTALAAVLGAKGLMGAHALSFHDGPH